MVNIYFDLSVCLGQSGLLSIAQEHSVFCLLFSIDSSDSIDIFSSNADSSVLNTEPEIAAESENFRFRREVENSNGNYSLHLYLIFLL